MASASVTLSTADNKGLRSLSIQHHENVRLQYLAGNTDCDGDEINMQAQERFWIVNIKFGGQTSENLFEGWSLQQLVDAVFEFGGVNGEWWMSWDLYLQGSLLSMTIGNYDENFSGNKDWCLMWDNIKVSSFVACGEVINIRLYPKVSASIFAGKIHCKYFLC